MENTGGFLSYPISLAGKPEYWKKRARFMMEQSRFRAWALIAVEAGRFSYEIDSIVGEAGPGDVVFIPPKALFTRVIHEPLTYFYTPFRFLESYSVEHDRVINYLQRPLGFHFKALEQERLFNTFRQLKGLFGQYDSVNLRWYTQFFSDIWLLFYMETMRVLQPAHVAFDPLMEEARKWLDLHNSENVQLKKLASELGLHPVQFSRRFQKHFGVLPSHYLTSIRMEKAKTLLVQTDYTLDHIAQLCGYDNGYYFSRIFTKTNHMNPSLYRKTHDFQSL